MSRIAEDQLRLLQWSTPGWMTHVEVSSGLCEFVPDCGRELVVKAERAPALGELGDLVLFHICEPALYSGGGILEVSRQ